MFSKDFKADMRAIMEAEEPFALARFHDGEHAILERLPYRAASGWQIHGGDVWCRGALYEALVAKLPGYAVGISPLCCAPVAGEYYRRHVQTKEVTYATLFSHANYAEACKLRDVFEDAALVSCKNGDFQVPKTATTTPWDLDLLVDELLEVERPILVAAGPCASIIVYRYWLRQAPDKRQTILDVGSALDWIVHEKPTRIHHNAESLLRSHVCSWNEAAPFAPVHRKQLRRARKRAEAHQRMIQEANADRPQQIIHRTGRKPVKRKQPNTQHKALARKRGGVTVISKGSTKAKRRSRTRYIGGALKKK